MLPDVSGAEFLLVAAIALIVVGPKDLPMLMRKVGAFTAKMRAMAADFRSSFDEMARQSELDDLRREVEAMREARLADITGLNDTLKPYTEMDQAFDAPAWHDAEIEPEPQPEPRPKRAARSKPAPKVKAKTTAKSKSTSKPRKVAASTAARPRARKTPA